MIGGLSHAPIVGVEIDRQSRDAHVEEQVQRAAALQGQTSPKERVAPGRVEQALEPQHPFQGVCSESGLPEQPGQEHPRET